MKFKIYILTIIMFLFFSGVLKSIENSINDYKTVYDFTMKDIDGNNVSLSKFKGKVILLVNVASKCGFTKQYKGLQELYLKYKDRGFVVLGFPANNFLRQEPGTNKEIKKFCSLNYGVTFPMFSKISVKGKKIAPLYKFLTDKVSNPEFPGKIRWNFEKFIFGRDGKPAARFHPRVKPTNPKLIKVLEEELNKK